MKKFCLAILLLFTVGFAAGENYFDVGGGTMPLFPDKKCTYISAGKRFQSYRSGVDFSVSHRVTSSCQNYISGSVLVTQNLTDNLYVGVGPGIGSMVNFNKGSWSTAQAATVEGVIGYKLPKGQSPITPHIQLGVTQPTHIFHNGTGKPLSRKPAFSLALNLTY